MWELLPPEIQETLKETIDEFRTASAEEKSRSAGTCPRCGGKTTTDCQNVDRIRDATVGLCIHCGYLWCIECASALMTSVRCGHWNVCIHCGQPKDAYGYCTTEPAACPFIQDWLARHHPNV